MEQIRDLVFYRGHFHRFFDRQTEKVKEKIDYVLFLVTHVERIPEKFLKHIEGHKGLYEIRVEVSSNIFRIFCCFEKGRVVVLFNATQKTPKQELELAIKLMNEYFGLNK